MIEEISTHELLKQKPQKIHNFKNLTPEITKKIRKIFLVPEVLTRFNIQDVCWNAPSKYQIKSLLCEEHFLMRQESKII